MEQSEFHCKLIHLGKTYGEINVKSDGSFSGTIESPYIHAVMVEMLNNGLADGLTLTTHAVPAVPAVPLREFKTEPIPDSIMTRQLERYKKAVETRNLVADLLNREHPDGFSDDIQNPDWDGS
jgi:hypothetical protein